MRPPPRLLEKGATEEERQLLVAGSVEQPSEDWMRSSRLALGLGSGLVAATVSTSVAAGAKAGLPIAVKIAALLSISAVVGSVAFVALHREAPAPPARSLVASPAPANPAPPPQVVESLPSEPSPADLVAEPAPVPTSVTKSPALGAAPSSTSSAKSLASEIAAIDEIKQLLVGGDPSAALSAIAKYRRDYPKPALGPEASVLEVQALTARGDRARAVALAKRFVKMYPSSPHARQFESLLSEAPHDP
jgi:hypothetical protein